MAAKIAPINVRVTSTTSAFEKGIRLVRKTLSKLGSRIVNVTKKVVKFSSVMAGVAAGAFVAMVKKNADAIDTLAKTSDKLGVGIEDLQGFRRAAELSGVSTETLDMALQRMTRRVAEAASGTGEAKDALKELRLDAAQLHQAGPAEAFRLIADALSGVSNQSDRVRLAFKLFDAEGVGLVNTLAGGSAALDDIRAEMEATGQIVSRLDAAKVEAMNDSFTNLQGMLSGLGVNITANLAAPVEFGVLKLQEMIDEYGGLESIATTVSNTIIVGFSKILTIFHNIQIFITDAETMMYGFVAAVQSALSFLDIFGEASKLIFGESGGFDNTKTVDAMIASMEKSKQLREAGDPGAKLLTDVAAFTDAKERELTRAGVGLSPQQRSAAFQSASIPFAGSGANMAELFNFMHSQGITKTSREEGITFKQGEQQLTVLKQISNQLSQGVPATVG